MIITDIKKQRKNSKRFSIFINGEFAFGLSDVDVLYYKLNIDDKISKEKYDYMIHEVIFIKAKDKAYRYIGYKMRTEKEVRTKLQEDFQDDIIDKVVSLLYEYEYLDDKKYSIAFIKDKVGLGKDGKNKIRYALYKKGVDDIIIDEVFNDFPFNEKPIIMELLEKRLRLKDKSKIDTKEKQKQINYLYQKGFAYDDINNSFDDFLNK